MEKNTQDKFLIETHSNSIFYKMKCFFKHLFSISNTYNSAIEVQQDNNIIKNTENNSFMERIQKTDDETTILIKLQEQHLNGEIKSEDLSSEQINLLCGLYDKQIADLKKSNAIKKQKVLEYKKQLKLN